MLFQNILKGMVAFLTKFSLIFFSLMFALFVIASTPSTISNQARCGIFPIFVMTLVLIPYSIAQYINVQIIISSVKNKFFKIVSISLFISLMVFFAYPLIYQFVIFQLPPTTWITSFTQRDRFLSCARVADQILFSSKTEVFVGYILTSLLIHMYDGLRKH
jgi:hypothetical protein